MAANPVGWVEIGGKDPAKLAQFYSEAFGWPMNQAPGMNYHMADMGDPNAVGVGIGEGGPTGDYVTFYVAVDDPQAYLDKIERLGGKTVMPVTVIPDMVTMAMFADPEGHFVGIIKNQM